jgi:AcrR family transcriptional regulator
MNANATATDVRQRILETAIDLFYRQGFRATGINQVIKESGVAKASFYAHFPSKNDLFYEYAREMARRDLAQIQHEVRALPTARDRFFGPLRVLVPWFLESEWRGCPFQNIMPEIPPEDQRARSVTRHHKVNFRNYFRELAADLVAEEPELKGLDCTAIADTYLILFEGSLATAVGYQDAWPVDAAIRVLEKLLECAKE